MIAVVLPWFDDDFYQAEKSAFEILSVFAKENVHLMHLTMVAKTIMICISLNAMFMSTIKVTNFAEMLRPALHDFGKI